MSVLDELREEILSHSIADTSYYVHESDITRAFVAFEQAHPGLVDMKWRTGSPSVSGYYLAAWPRGEIVAVSELWFNDTSGWWSSRGYFNQPRQEGPHSLRVIAWMPMPLPPREVHRA